MMTRWELMVGHGWGVTRLGGRRNTDWHRAGQWVSLPELRGWL